MADKNKTKNKKNTEKIKKTKLKNSLQTLLYFCIILAVIAAIILFAMFVLDPISIYRSAGKLAEEGNYAQAIERYESLDGFFNSEKKIFELRNNQFVQYVADGEYGQAVALAENSGEIEKYVAEMPGVFYEYAKQQAEINPSVAQTYISYVTDYPGAKELYDEICLRNARFQVEMHRYAEVLQSFDAASSFDWLTTLDAQEAYDYAEDIARCSYLRAAKVLDLLTEDEKATQRRAQLEPYLACCGEKTCISDTAGDAVNAVNVFDFFIEDETEYLIVVNGNMQAVYDAGNNAFAKDTDGSYFALTDDFESGISYEYRFYLLENGSIQEKMTATFKDGTVSEYTRLWS